MIQGGSPVFRAHFYLILSAVVYGCTFTIVKWILGPGYLEPGGFILLRVTVAAVLFTVLHVNKLRILPKREDFPLILLCAICGVAANMLLFFHGLKRTSPVHGALLMLCTPIVVVLFSRFAEKHAPTSRQITGILIALTGTMLLIFLKENLWDQTQFQPDILGDLMVFANAIIYGIYLLLIRILGRKYDILQLVHWSFCLGVILVFPFGIQDLIQTNWQEIPLNIWVYILFICVFSSFFTYLWNGFALKHLSTQIVGSYIYLQPFLATLFAVGIGVEQLTLQKCIAGIIICVGLYWTTSSPSLKKVL